AFAKLIETGEMFKRESETTWRCRNCGYNHVGTEAPTVCPACAHPQAHFELLAENW
ncbi:MAG: rubrerythrin family protein, partial [Candidatus Bipolaricaulota bacterium]|nr:rubrerythrin family protein [Candidatus Bipolaricaulota bacterium]